MQNDKQFSVRRRMMSFRYAFDGLALLWAHQHNFRIHVLMALLVILAAWFLSATFYEWCLLFVCIGAVMTAEAFNSALEYIVDLVSPDYHPLAKQAKDAGAAAVLLMSIASAMVGLWIFVPKILRLI